MAIIIPSSNIYSLENNKVIDNEIDGVTFAQSSYQDKKISYWKHNGYKDNDRATQKDTKYGVGEWFYTSKTERKRLYVTAQREQYSRQMTGVSSNFSISSLSSVKVKFTQTVVDMPTYNDPEYNHEDHLYRIQYTVPYRTSGYMTRVPNYPISEDELNFYGDTLFSTLSAVGYAFDYSPPYLAYWFVVRNQISIQTEQKNGEEWEKVSEELVYFKDGYKNNPNKNGETDRSIYEIEVFSDISAVETTNVIVGNENSAYSLPSNDLFTAEAKIGGKELGKYVSEQIIQDYRNGKETAEVLCSISNYYDDEGKQVKFDNGENMVFDLYDIVVPMKYNSSGADEPISTENESVVKTFAVLGVEIFYDGAVWQKLTLQEYGKLDEILLPLSAPIISINGSILTITDTSGIGEVYRIYVDGEVRNFTYYKQIDLDEYLSLDSGKYTINIVTEASHHQDSPFSNSVIYIVYDLLNIGESRVEISTYAQATHTLFSLLGLQGKSESDVNAMGVANQFIIEKLASLAEHRTYGTSNLTLFQVMPMSSKAQSDTEAYGKLRPFGMISIKYNFEIKTYTSCIANAFTVLPMSSKVEINTYTKAKAEANNHRHLGSYNFEIKTFTSAKMHTPKYLRMSGNATSNTEFISESLHIFDLLKLKGESENHNYATATGRLFVIMSMRGLGESETFGNGTLRLFILKALDGVAENNTYGSGKFTVPSVIRASGTSESTTSAIASALKWSPPILENNTLKISTAFSASVVGGILEII